MSSLPPRVVVGLTGPIASGCSTLARFFDDPDDFDRQHGNRFLKTLIKGGDVLQRSDSLVVNWVQVNQEIAARLHEHMNAGSRSRYNEEMERQDRSQRFKDIGRLLERRESLKALEFIKPYYPQGKPHLFRTLSMSDVIVFRALLETEKGSCSGHTEFDSLAESVLGSIKKKMHEETGIHTISSFYNQISKPDKPERLIRAFKNIHRATRELKKNLMIDTEGKDVEILQQFGNNIRKSGNPFADRKSGSSATKYAVQLAQDMEKVINLIHEAHEAAFFVVDCLRNPYEVLYFRQRFPLFYLVSIYAEKEIRFRRRFRDMMIKGAFGADGEAAKDEFDKIDDLDSGKQSKGVVEQTYKQDVTRCVQMSDYAINNTEDRPDAQGVLHDKLLRLVSLVLSPGSSKPRKEEVYMNMAYTMAVKSNCICRQVGAVIAGEDGYIVGAGWNDVASRDISCGLRPLCDLRLGIHRQIHEQVRKNHKLRLEEDYERRRRHGYKEYPIDQACFCFKDEMAKNEVTKKLKNALDREERFSELKRDHEKDIDELVKIAGLHQPEYCLALHAEENAVIQGSRIGGPGVRGGTIYVTAQPCTLCAKTIKQAGIVKVIYTDPYPKSLSDVFMNEVEHEQFEGVKPRAYIRLFMPSHDQKEWQDLEVQNAIPGFDLVAHTYLYPLG